MSSELRKEKEQYNVLTNKKISLKIDMYKKTG
jgi:hypothetical protein